MNLMFSFLTTYQMKYSSENFFHDAWGIKAKGGKLIN